MTTLYAAIQNGDAKVVEAILEHISDVNSEEKSDVLPLHVCAEVGNEAITKLVLNKGAKVNSKQDDGTTALHIATRSNNKEVVEILLKHGAKVDCETTDHVTPLHIAAENGYLEIVEILLEFGADVDFIDECGRTPLHVASKEGREEVVAALLEYGSDVNIKSNIRYTPLNYVNSSISKLYNLFNSYDFDHFEHYDSDDDNSYHNHEYEKVADILEEHIVKMKMANLYVSKQNLPSASVFQDEYLKEIECMKSEKISDNNVCFCDFLTDNLDKLAVYLRNESIVQTLKSNDYKRKFPHYATMIESYFRKGMERKELMEQCNILFKFPKLPYNCIEEIFSYLSNKDLRKLTEAANSTDINE